MEYRFTRYEMETTENYNAEEKIAVLYTRDKAVMRRMDKLVKDFPDIFKCIASTDVDKTYQYPKKYAGPRRPRIMSEERREEARDRLAKARAKKQDESDNIEDFEDDDFENEDLEDDDEGEMNDDETDSI